MTPTLGDLLSAFGMFGLGLLLGYIVGRDRDRRNP